MSRRPLRATIGMSDIEPQFDLLLEYLKRTRGFDFSGYKRGGLMRRIQKRITS